MRATRRCDACAVPIRVARLEDGRYLTIDTEAVTDGNVWVLDWDGGNPTVRVEPSPESVPASVPLRYTAHDDTCTGGKP